MCKDLILTAFQLFDEWNQLERTKTQFTFSLSVYLITSLMQGPNLASFPAVWWVITAGYGRVSIHLFVYLSNDLKIQGPYLDSFSAVWWVETAGQGRVSIQGRLCEPTEAGQIIIKNPFVYKVVWLSSL